jgi:hypothetical protein
VLLGVQEPRFLYLPAGVVSSAGQEAVDLSKSAGLVLEPHQCNVLEGALSERRDGRWAAFEVANIEPRQNGKGATMTGRELAGIHLFEEPLQTHTAHRFDTCLEGFRKIRDIIEGEGNAWLRRGLHKITEAHGQEAIEYRNPTRRLIFKARAKGSGVGFTGDTVYLDEAYWLMALGNMVPTMSARPNPQLWYFSSAPHPIIQSEVLRRVCRRGRSAARGKTRPRRFAYYEWSAHVDLGLQPDGRIVTIADIDLDNRTYLAQANPGLGFRLTETFSESERAAMTDEEYARERLGLYMDSEEVAIDTVIDHPDWSACRSPRSQPVDPVAFSFEVSLDRKWAQIGTAAPSTLGGTHVEIVENRKGTGWVIDRLVELRDTHKPMAVVCNPAGPAGVLLPEAERKGLVVGIPEEAGKVHQITGRDYQQACGAALDDITEHRWKHLGQPELDKAVANATRRDVGDAMVFDRKGNVDISPLTCVSLAAWAAGQPVPEDENVEPFVVVT